MKAILIMDMPSSCMECQFCYNEDFPMCEAGGRRIKDDDIEKRQEWCPLREVPKKMELYGARDGIARGYNQCIDEILGGAENG